MFEISFLRYSYTMAMVIYNLHILIVLKTLFLKFLVCGTISHDESQIINIFKTEYYR